MEKRSLSFPFWMHSMTIFVQITNIRFRFAESVHKLAMHLKKNNSFLLLLLLVLMILSSFVSLVIFLYIFPDLKANKFSFGKTLFLKCNETDMKSLFIAVWFTWPENYFVKEKQRSEIFLLLEVGFGGGSSAEIQFWLAFFPPSKFHFCEIEKMTVVSSIINGLLFFVQMWLHLHTCFFHFSNIKMLKAAERQRNCRMISCLFNASQ